MSKKVEEENPIEFLFKNLYSIQTNYSTIPRRIQSIISSPQFYQLGYNKASTEKFKELVKENEDFCFFLHIFEMIVKSFSKDILSPFYENVEEAMEFFGFFEDPYERVLVNDLSQMIISITSSNLVYFWIEFSSALFKLTDKMGNVQIMLDKKVRNCIKHFMVDREFRPSILAHQKMGELISAKISYLQSIYFLAKKDTDLRFEGLVELMSSYFTKSKVNFDVYLLKFILLMSISSKKLEYQPLKSLRRGVLIDFSEFVEFIVRISWVLAIESEEPSLKITYINYQKRSETSEDSHSFIEDAHDKTEIMINKLYYHVKPKFDELGIKEMSENVFSLSERKCYDIIES